jgi:hypothetical protein
VCLCGHAGGTGRRAPVCGADLNTDAASTTDGGDADVPPPSVMRTPGRGIGARFCGACGAALIGETVVAANGDLRSSPSVECLRPQ